MEPSSVWVEDQLYRADVDSEVSALVVKLVMACRGVGEVECDEALALARKLVRHEAIYVPQTVEEVWVPAMRGFLSVTDVVRVKSDAYTSTAGEFHNGRVGHIVAIRYGDIIVKYDDDRLPVIDSVRHSPDVLEKRIR